MATEQDTFQREMSEALTGKDYRAFTHLPRGSRHISPTEYARREAEKAKITRIAAEMLTDEYIAGEQNIPRALVQEYIRQHNLRTLQPGGRERLIRTPTMIEILVDLTRSKIIELRGKGIKVSEIAEELGLDDDTTIHIIRKLIAEGSLVPRDLNDYNGNTKLPKKYRGKKPVRRT